MGVPLYLKRIDCLQAEIYSVQMEMTTNSITDKDVEKVLNTEVGIEATKTKDVRETPVHGALPTGVVEKKIGLEEKAEATPSIEIVGVESHKSGGKVVSEATAGLSGEQIMMVPSQMHDYYKYEGFGQASTTQTALAGSGYNVNMRPLAIDQSPLKELAPQFEEIQPITAYKKALGHEHSYVYTFHLPDGVRNTESFLKNDCPYGTATAWSIPALTVLKENLLGLPLQGSEWPVVASANPTSSNSYLHGVIHRVDKSGVLDLRFQITASKKYNVKEAYIMGRIWTPLTNIHIAWENAAENYDAAQPSIYPAFVDIGKITLDTRKELTNLTQMLRFIDKTFPPDIEQSMVGILEGLGRNKLSFSRLYWRIWCCIAEASLCESQNKRWRVKRVYNTNAPMTLNGPVVLKDLFSESQMAIQPFFITHNMLDSIGGAHLIELFQFLLCESFDCKCNFGITKNWPSLGDVRMVFPAGHTALHSIPSDMVVHSEELYAILAYFAKTLGQQHLIDEIGKTVSMFLLRPEGDHAWLGHSFISMRLPPFRCKRSLHFAWANADNPLDYPLKTPPYYKLAWLGSIRYLQIGLSANTVLAELGLYSGLQLENSGVKMSQEWCVAMYRLFSKQCGSCELNTKIQHVGLRCDWGCLLNRITSSIIIMRPLLTNFVRVPQWQEWLLFQRLQPESTWMAGQMGHIIPKTILQPQISYNPTLCGIDSGLGDIYYRLITDESADVMLHAVSLAQAAIIVRKATSLCSSTGYPLDGQFRHLQIGDDINTYYHFVPRSEIACGKIMHDWHKRKQYHWQLCCNQNFFSDARGIRQGEVYLETSAMAPAREIGTGHFLNPKVKEPAHTLISSYEARMNSVLLYGNPESSDKEDEAIDEDDSSVEEQNPYPQGIRAAAVYEQTYPIHYCQADKQPTVGALMLKYGIATEMCNAGVTIYENQELYAMAAQAENLHELMTYKAPYPVEKRAKKYDLQYYHVNNTDIHGSDEAPNTVPMFDATSKMDRVAEKTRRKAQKRAEERRKMKEQMEQKEKERTKAMVTSIKSSVRVEISKLKDELRAFAKAWNADLTYLEIDPLWQAWDGMEELNAASTGSITALTCRYSNILRMYDNKDLIDLIRLVPRICRGELCRIILGMMSQCGSFLTSSSRDIAIHKSLKNFFSIATDNLQHCNILTEEELHSQFGCNHLRFSDWHCYGTMPFESFIEIPTKWTEEAENCKYKEQHKSCSEIDPQKIGRYSDTDEAYKPASKCLEPVAEEKELENKINEIVEESISKSPHSEEQGFRSAREHCSAQSPAISPCLAAVNSTESHPSEPTAEASSSSKMPAVGKQLVSDVVQARKATQKAVSTTTKVRTPKTTLTKEKVTPTKTLARFGSTVASRTRAKTKAAAVLKGMLSTGSSMKSFHSLDGMHSDGAVGAAISPVQATFEKMESDMSVESVPASIHGSPHFAPSL